MQHTPFFTAWKARLIPLGRRTALVCQTVRHHTLSRLEDCFGPWVPTPLFPKAREKANSRNRDYTPCRTFWCGLWHSLHPGAAGREVVRPLQALLRLHGGRPISQEDGAYFRARQRLPLNELSQALETTAQKADALAPPLTLLHGRRLKALDGTTLTLNDTPKNRKEYPAVQCRPEEPSFPMMRLGVLFSFVSGAILALAQGSLVTSELMLLQMLMPQLAHGDIVVGDRGFGCYPVIALLRHTLGVDFIGRTNRRVDGRRRLKRLGRNDGLVEWKKGGSASPWMSLAQWVELPQTLTVRAVKGSLYTKGFRVRHAIVITTWLDPELYPPREILQAYLRRWRLEMCLDDLKTTLQMEMLRNRSPEACVQEVHFRLIAHNLIRCLMAQVASEHAVPLERVSFKGSLDAVRHFSSALAQARSQKKRQELWAELRRTLASDLVPERPGRREPRAVKRRKHRYPRLRGPRSQFRDHLKRHQRRRISRARRQLQNLK